MKKYLAMILALVMALSLVACGDKKDDSADNSDGDTASGRVYWLNFKPEADESLQKVAAMYTEKTGVPVTVVTAASGTYNETLTAEMDKSAPPTLFVVGNQAAVDTWGDYCYDLSGTAVANELNTDAYTSMTPTASSAPSATATSATASSSTKICSKRPATRLATSRTLRLSRPSLRTSTLVLPSSASTPSPPLP